MVRIVRSARTRMRRVTSAIAEPIWRRLGKHSGNGDGSAAVPVARRKGMNVSRLVVLVIFVGPAVMVGQKKEELQSVQRDVAQLQEQVKQLQHSQDEKMAALQTLLQQAVDAANHTASGMTAMEKEVDAKLSAQQTSLVAPVAT